MAASSTLCIGGRHAQARTRSLASQWSRRSTAGDGGAANNAWRPTALTSFHTSATAPLTATSTAASTSASCAELSALSGLSNRLGPGPATSSRIAASSAAAASSTQHDSGSTTQGLSYSAMALCTAASMMMLSTTSPSATLAEAAPTPSPMATSSSMMAASTRVYNPNPLDEAKAHFMALIKRRGSTRKSKHEQDEHVPPSLLPQWLQFAAAAAAQCESQSLEETESDFLSKGEPYEVSVAAIQGRRETMEDEVLTTGGGRFVAVFDGHGGGDVSGYLRRHIYDLFLLHLERKHWEESDADVQDIQVRTPSIAAYMAALREALSSVEVEVMRHSSLNFVGSTAVAVVLHEIPGGTKTLISANIGDSRAVLSRRGKAVDLTKDHKPTSDSERRRILEAGGRIFLDDTGVHRVMNLSLSRAVGDKFSKPIVSAEPDIRRFRVEDDDDEFIILASDGLWDVMSSQDVVSFVHARLSDAKSQMIGLSREEQTKKWNEVRENMAHLVGAEALIGGSADNTSVVMVWLSDVESQHHST